jgi:hypothetical protein
MLLPDVFAVARPVKARCGRPGRSCCCAAPRRAQGRAAPLRFMRMFWSRIAGPAIIAPLRTGGPRRQCLRATAAAASRGADAFPARTETRLAPPAIAYWAYRSFQHLAPKVEGLESPSTSLLAGFQYPRFWQRKVRDRLRFRRDQFESSRNPPRFWTAANGSAAQPQRAGCDRHS